MRAALLALALACGSSEPAKVSLAGEWGWGFKTGVICLNGSDPSGEMSLTGPDDKLVIRWDACSKAASGTGSGSHDGGTCALDFGQFAVPDCVTDGGQIEGAVTGLWSGVTFEARRKP